MGQLVEVSLRIPNTKHRRLGPDGFPIDHASVRFRRTVPVATIPKPGESLTLPTASQRTLLATVVQADWSEDKGMFVVACRYAPRSISAEECEALFTDPEWVMTPLL